MIKIKVKDGKGETEVDGAVIELMADAGVIIRALKDMIKRERLMPDKEMKTYLTAIVLADKSEDVAKFLKLEEKRF
jgi:hypothetical protein